MDDLLNTCTFVIKGTNLSKFYRKLFTLSPNIKSMTLSIGNTESIVGHPISIETYEVSFSFDLMNNDKLLRYISDSYPEKIIIHLTHDTSDLSRISKSKILIAINEQFSPADIKKIYTDDDMITIGYIL